MLHGIEVKLDDRPEFTDEQLRAALQRMGKEAREAAFAASRSIVVLKGRLLVEVHPDGTESVLKQLPENEPTSR